MSATKDGPLAGGSQRGSSAACKLLLDAATPEMFRRNAFRLTGLPVDAKTREITKRAEKLEIMGEVGFGVNTGALALDTPPTTDQIREAIHRLKDPEQRIIDEFFWFWPRQFGQSACDPAIKAIEGGDADSAFAIWTAMESNPSDGHVAMHNIAVLQQLMAIEWENHYARNAEFTETRRREVDEFWRAAFKRWNVLSVDDLFWENVSGRIKQLDDPRLTGGFMRRMRATLPRALAKLNAELALRYAESGKMELAQVHVQFIREIKLGVSDMEKTAELVLAPATARLKQQCQDARTRGARAPADAVKAALELLAHARRALPLFEMFFGKESELRNELSDEVAALCNVIQVASHKVTHDHKSCLDLLKVTLPFAISVESRRQIESNMKVLENFVKVQVSHISPTRLRSLLAALRDIDGSGAFPKAKLAKIKQDVMPGLKELMQDGGSESADANTLANSIAVSLRAISIDARLNHRDVDTAVEAMQSAFELAREPELKFQLTQDKAQVTRWASEVKKRRDQDKAKPTRVESEQEKARTIIDFKPPEKASAKLLEPIRAVLKALQESREKASVRLSRFKSEAVPAISKLLADSAEDSEKVAAMLDTAAIVLREISLAAWDTHKEIESNVHKDIRTAVAANELAAKYTLDAKMKKRLAAERSALLKLDAEMRKGRAADRLPPPKTEPEPVHPGTKPTAKPAQAGAQPKALNGLVMLGLIALLPLIVFFTRSDPSRSKITRSMSPIRTDSISRPSPSFSGNSDSSSALPTPRPSPATISVSSAPPWIDTPPAPLAAPTAHGSMKESNHTIATISPPPSVARSKGASTAPVSISSELGKEKRAIDIEKAKAAKLEGQLNHDRQEIDIATRGAAQLQKQVASLYTQVNQARASLDPTKPSAVDEYHRLSDVYGAMLENLRAQNETVKQLTNKYNARGEQVRSENITVNRMVDDYNAKLRRNNAPHPDL